MVKGEVKEKVWEEISDLLDDIILDDNFVKYVKELEKKIAQFCNANKVEYAGITLHFVVDGSSAKLERLKPGFKPVKDDNDDS